MGLPTGCFTQQRGRYSCGMHSPPFAPPIVLDDPTRSDIAGQSNVMHHSPDPGGLSRHHQSYSVQPHGYWTYLLSIGYCLSYQACQNDASKSSLLICSSLQGPKGLRSSAANFESFARSLMRKSGSAPPPDAQKPPK